MAGIRVIETRSFIHETQKDHSRKLKAVTSVRENIPRYGGFHFVILRYNKQMSNLYIAHN